MAACSVFITETENIDSLVIKLLLNQHLQNFCIFSHWVHGRESVCACMQRAICVCPSIAGSVRVSLHLPHGCLWWAERWETKNGHHCFPTTLPFEKLKTELGVINGGCWEIKSERWGQAPVVEDVLIRAKMFVLFFQFCGSGGVGGQDKRIYLLHQFNCSVCICMHSNGCACLR